MASAYLYYNDGRCRRHLVIPPHWKASLLTCSEVCCCWLLRMHEHYAWRSTQMRLCLFLCTYSRALLHAAIQDTQYIRPEACRLCFRSMDQGVSLIRTLDHPLGTLYELKLYCLSIHAVNTCKGAKVPGQDCPALGQIQPTL